MWSCLKVRGTFPSPPPLPGLFRCSHACLTVGVILQISRLISLARFGQSVPVADSQALNAEDAVTVAEPRWPPPIQNPTAAVVTDRDYANVQRTVGLRPKHPRRLRLKAVT